MNLEINRLRSFDSCQWLGRIFIEANRFANAGLYFVGPADTVRCFSCNGTLKSWNSSQSPKTRHKLSFPSCRFVNGNEVLNISIVELDKCTPHSSRAHGVQLNQFQRDDENNYRAVGLSSRHNSIDNFQKINDSKRAFDVVVHKGASDYTIESNRLESFADWPLSSPVDGYDLAAAGFFQTPQKTVKCVACFGEIFNWKLGDKPKFKHIRMFPSCPFVRQLQRKRTSGRDLSKQCEFVVAGTGQINLKENFKYPNFSSENTRFGSFVNWPEAHLKRSLKLAKAGFFVNAKNNRGDLVTCFCCGVQLDHWEPSDDPWEEHARWSPVCSWLLEMKGDLFPKEMREEDSKPESSAIYNPSQKMMPEKLPIQESYSDSYPEIRKPTASTTIGVTDDEDNSRDKSDDYCQVCFRNNAKVVFLPCQHLAACEDCSHGLRKCPACSSRVDDIVKFLL